MTQTTNKGTKYKDTLGINIYIHFSLLVQTSYVKKKKQNAYW